MIKFHIWIGIALIGLGGKLYAQKQAPQTYTSLQEALRQPEKVEILDLGGQKIGVLPPEIGKLINLRKLILYSNALRMLPPEIATLQKLEILDLYDNHLRDLPLALASLQTLTRLDVGKNRLRNLPAPVTALVKLEKLYLYSNRIKKLSPDIANLKNLKELRLGGGLRFWWNGNHLRHLPESIGELQQLEELHLPDNGLRHLPTSFARLRRLRYLELLGNRFKQVPTEVLALDSLRLLSIWDRHFGKTHKAIVTTRLPRTRVEYEKELEGNFTALTLSMAQGAYTEAKIGLARAFKKDFILVGTSLSAGYQFKPNAYTIQANAWANGLSILTIGLGAVHYGSLGNERQFATGVAPEIGVGKGLWRIYYSHTWAWGRFTTFNRHTIQAQILIPL